MLTLTELERIAQLSYYRMHCNMFPDEMNELIVLLIKWKKDSDSFIRPKGESEPDLDVCPECGERAWDGRICHVCGTKEI